MRRFLRCVVVLLALLSASPVGAAGLVDNGHFALGLAGWTASGAVWRGTASFADGVSGWCSIPAGGSLSQSVSWLAGGTGTLSFYAAPSVTGSRLQFCFGDYCETIELVSSGRFVYTVYADAAESVALSFSAVEGDVSLDSVSLQSHRPGQASSSSLTTFDGDYLWLAVEAAVRSILDNDVIRNTVFAICALLAADHLIALARDVAETRRAERQTYQLGYATGATGGDPLLHADDVDPDQLVDYFEAYYDGVDDLTLSRVSGVLDDSGDGYEDDASLDYPY